MKKGEKVALWILGILGFGAATAAIVLAVKTMKAAAAVAKPAAGVAASDAKTDVPA